MCPTLHVTPPYTTHVRDAQHKEGVTTFRTRGECQEAPDTFSKVRDAVGCLCLEGPLFAVSLCGQRLLLRDVSPPVFFLPFFLCSFLHLLPIYGVFFLLIFFLRLFLSLSLPYLWSVLSFFRSSASFFLHLLPTSSVFFLLIFFLFQLFFGILLFFFPLLGGVFLSIFFLPVYLSLFFIS